MSHRTIHHMHTWALHGIWCTCVRHTLPSMPTDARLVVEDGGEMLEGTGLCLEVTRLRLEVRGERLEVRGKRLEDTG
jgi:hypothetical protein